MKQTIIRVLPNVYTEFGFEFVIYEKTWFPLFWRELGRCETVQKLRSFAEQYHSKNGRTLEHAL
jgi:hypothetical protein